MAFTGKFTPRAQRALSAAHDAAVRLGHNYVGTEHLLLGLISEISPEMESVLGPMDYKAALEATERLVGRGDGTQGQPNLTARTRKVLDTGALEARQLDHPRVDLEHLWLALLREDEGVAARVLQDMGMDLRTMRENIRARLKETKGDAKGEGGTPMLDKYTRDLTAAAAQGKLDPVIGRENEIERLVGILIRRTKNNPVLIGEPGVGKSAIVEGLAQRIASGSLRHLLGERRILSLDVAGMIAGSKYRGEYEERFKGMIEEAKAAGDVLLFIDEMHTLIGAGGAEGAIDASNMLKPALARGEITCIGATTLDEYRKKIEKDPAFERRFQPVRVDEPTEAESEAILRGLREKYEAHHRLRIRDDALTAAVRLSARYVSDRFLPDKAIDLMDEAAANVRLRLAEHPS